MSAREPVFVVLAAGMGSRFGGLKQITPVDECGNKLIDYSLYDARRAGFKKVVFIIKHEIEDQFKDAVGRRMEKYFDVRYSFQELDMLPDGFDVPDGRKKPWGTAHAVLCAADWIDGPFAIINSDDYYGISSIQRIYDFLIEENDPGEHAMIGYHVKNTVPDSGYVSRGECTVRDGYLVDVTERTHIEKRGSGLAYTEDEGKTWTDLPGETFVSMNLWGFQHDILRVFKDRFSGFLNDNLSENPLKCEYFLPYVVNTQIKEGTGRVRLIPTSDVWHGMTYAEDLAELSQALSKLRDEGMYPGKLWE